jgi:hypothetical protein
MALRKLTPTQFTDYSKRFGLTENNLVRKNGDIYLNEDTLGLQNQASLFGQDLDVATGRLNQSELAPFQAPDALKGLLAGSPLTQDFNSIAKQFSDPNSPLFVSNPFARQQVVQEAQGAQKRTFGSVLDRIQNLIGLGTTQQRQQVSGLQTRLGGIQDAMKAEAAAQQQAFENQLALERLNISRRSSFTPKFTQQEAADHLDLFLKGRLTESQIPADMRSYVLGGAELFKSSPVGKGISGFMQQLRGGVDPGSREDLIEAILSRNSEATYADVARTVYTYIPDDVEAYLKAEIQSGKSSHQKLIDSLGLKPQK